MWWASLRDRGYTCPMAREIIQPGGIPALVPDSYGAPSSSLQNGRPAFQRPGHRQGIRDTGRTTKPLGAPTVPRTVNPVNPSLVSPDGLVRGARNQALARNLYRRHLKLAQSQSPSSSPLELHNRAIDALGFTPPGITAPTPVRRDPRTTASSQPRPGTIGPPSNAGVRDRRPLISPSALGPPTANVPRAFDPISPNAAGPPTTNVLPSVEASPAVRRRQGPLLPRTRWSDPSVYDNPA